jgi:hypothetical protein
VSAERNKATFRRYVEEVGNEGNLDLAEEIFDRYRAHQPDGAVFERGPEDVVIDPGPSYCPFSSSGRG